MRKLFLWVLLVSAVLLANDAESNTSKTNIMSHKDGSFGFKIEAKDVRLSILLNGFEIFSDHFGQEVNSFMPVNPFITSGKNELVDSKSNTELVKSEWKGHQDLLQPCNFMDATGIKPVKSTAEVPKCTKLIQEFFN